MAQKEIRRRVLLEQVPDGYRVGVISAETHPAREKIIEHLVTGTKKALMERGVARRDVLRASVHRPFDLPFAAQRMMESHDVDGIICIGLLVRDHPRDEFDFESEAVAQGIMKLNVKGTIPVIYAVLTCMNEGQARQLIGGDEDSGHVKVDHGWEWAKALIGLLRVQRELEYERGAAVRG